MNHEQFIEIETMLHILKLAMEDMMKKWCLYGGTYEVEEEMSKIKNQIKDLSENLH